MRFFLGMLALTIGSWGTYAQADALLSWPAAGPDVASYELHYDSLPGQVLSGTFADQGASPITLAVGELAEPQRPSFRLTGGPGCTVLHFEVRAIDRANSYSGQARRFTAISLHTIHGVAAHATRPDALGVSWTGPQHKWVQNVQRYVIHYAVDPMQPTHFTNQYAVNAADLNDPLSPQIELEGLQPGSTISLAVAAPCQNGAHMLSDVLTIEMPPGTKADNVAFSGGTIVGGCSLPGSTPSSPVPLTLLCLVFFALGSRRQRLGP